MCHISQNNAEKAKNAVLTNLLHMQAGLHKVHSCFIVENTLFYVQLNLLYKGASQ
jgi:hypothetical protein